MYIHRHKKEIFTRSSHSVHVVALRCMSIESKLA